MNRTSPATASGVATEFAPPAPSCPRSFPPQQYARPSALSMHECKPPAATVTRDAIGAGIGATGVGTGAGVGFSATLSGVATALLEELLRAFVSCFESALESVFAAALRAEVSSLGLSALPPAGFVVSTDCCVTGRRVGAGDFRDSGRSGGRRVEDATLAAGPT